MSKNFDDDLTRLIQESMKGVSTTSSAKSVTTTTAPAVPIEVEEHEVVPGQHRAGELFSIEGDSPALNLELTVNEDDVWPEWARAMIPDVDSSYIFPRKQTESLLSFLFRPSKRACLIHGPTGTGKSTIVEQLAARLRIPLFRVRS